MKLMTSILLWGLAVTAWAQNPDVIQDTRTTMKLLQQKQALDSDAALRASQGDGSKPASGQAKVVPPKPSATGKSVTALPPAPKPSNASKQVPVKANAGKTLAAHKTAPGLKPAGASKADAKPASTKTGAAKKPQPKQRIAVEDKSKPAQPQKNQAEVINLTGRRDPFISPVVNRSMVGSGCSTGKRCLSIGEVNLKGVVKADTGMIAVVVNTMNKAYFLRENDPVFNGYVVKITGDSIIFKETLQDKLGKPFTRDVTKKITTPAV
jgi:Tfp pilus assembly protein PilP